MLTKNVLRSRKAISPILATLLLIVIAVAAIVVTYAWIMTYMSSAGQQAGVMMYKANYRFYIESGTRKIDIDIGNSGTADTKIAKIYVGNSSGNLIERTPTQELPLSLAAGLIETVTINYNWTAGTTYYFNILSSSGQALPFSEKAP